jgi:hypothetical protein
MILEFLVTIFPPHTTVEADLSIQRCFLLLTQFRTSILTGKIPFRSFSSIAFFLLSKIFLLIYRKQGMIKKI